MSKFINSESEGFEQELDDLVFLALIVQVDLLVLVFENMSDFLFEFFLDFVVLERVSVFFVFLLLGGKFVIEISNQGFNIEGGGDHVSSGDEVIEVDVLDERFHGSSSLDPLLVHLLGDFSGVPGNSCNQTVSESPVFGTFVYNF